jgi:hypothetical protein
MKGGQNGKAKYGRWPGISKGTPARQGIEPAHTIRVFIGSGDSLIIA